MLLVSCGGADEDLDPGDRSIDVCTCAKARESGTLNADEEMRKKCEELAVELGTDEVRRKMARCEGVMNITVNICTCKEAMISGKLDSDKKLMKQCNQLAMTMSDREFDLALEQCDGEIPEEMVREAEATEELMTDLMRSWESHKLNLTFNNDGTYIAIHNLEDYRVEEGIWTVNRDTLVLISDSTESFYPIKSVTTSNLILSVDGGSIELTPYEN